MHIINQSTSFNLSASAKKNISKSEKSFSVNLLTCVLFNFVSVDSAKSCHLVNSLLSMT